MSVFLQLQKFLPILAFTLLAMALFITDAHAARKRFRQPAPLPETWGPATVNAKWKEECSACHMAFQPGLMQAEFWQNIMSTLDKHFGRDASLDEGDTKEITAFLVENASTRWTYSPVPTRIRDAGWFKQRHDQHEKAWNNPMVKTSANCIACHKSAANGDFRSGGGGCGGKCHSFDTF